MTLPNLQFFPVPQNRSLALQDSYWRELIPGTHHRYQRGYHYGIDIHGENGFAIGVVYPGVVEAVGNIWGNSFGYHQVLVKHSFWTITGRKYFWTFYAHMQDYRVRPGQSLVKGQRIGDMDTQGQTTGTHLHIEIHTGDSFEHVLDANPQPARHSYLYTQLERLRTH